MAACNDINWSIDASVGRIVLNRPAFHNAISKQMWDELPPILSAIKESGAKLVVFSGSGSSFASGADIGELEQLASYEAAQAHWYSIRDCLNSIWDFELPTIAMINGPCLGGGLLLALACDLRYAADTASFAVPIARLGIVLDDANICRLIGTVGLPSAKELLFTGATISSAKALTIGLVNAVVESVKLESFVGDIAKQIDRNAAGSILQSKLSANRCLKAIGNAAAQSEDDVIGSYIGQELQERVKQRSNKF